MTKLTSELIEETIVELAKVNALADDASNPTKVVISSTLINAKLLKTLAIQQELILETLEELKASKK
jgi:hypothetical protein